MSMVDWADNPVWKEKIKGINWARNENLPVFYDGQEATVQLSLKPIDDEPPVYVLLLTSGETLKVNLQNEKLSWFEPGTEKPSFVKKKPEAILLPPEPEEEPIPFPNLPEPTVKCEAGEDNTGTTTPVLLRQIEQQEERTKDLLSEINLYNQFFGPDMFKEIEKKAVAQLEALTQGEFSRPPPVKKPQPPKPKRVKVKRETKSKPKPKIKPKPTVKSKPKPKIKPNYEIKEEESDDEYVPRIGEVLQEEEYVPLRGEMLREEFSPPKTPPRKRRMSPPKLPTSVPRAPKRTKRSPIVDAPLPPPQLDENDETNSVLYQLLNHLRNPPDDKQIYLTFCCNLCSGIYTSRVNFQDESVTHSCNHVGSLTDMTQSVQAETLSALQLALI